MSGNTKPGATTASLRRHTTTPLPTSSTSPPTAYGTSSLGQTPLPRDWANVVCPPYKKGDWPDPDNWHPIVCAVREDLIVWTILLRHVRPHLDPHIPASFWRAIPGRSPQDAMFLHDTAIDMDPGDLIIVSLDVKGAFLNTPWLLLEAVWKRLGLPFYNFNSKYIRTRKCTVCTEEDLGPCLEPGSAVSQGGADGPSCTFS